MYRKVLFRVVMAGLWLTAVLKPAFAAPLVRFDLTSPTGVSQWRPANDVSALRPTPDGMAIDISGFDPYIHGPARNYPPGQPLWLAMRVKTDHSGTAQVFYYPASGQATERNSVRVPITSGGWRDVRIPLPALDANTVLRLDPPGDRGTVLVASLSLEPRVNLPAPPWPRPVAPVIDGKALTLSSGDLHLAHAPDRLGAFRVSVAGRPMAVGHTRPMIGYETGGKARWLSLAEQATVTAMKDRSVLTVRVVARDADGGTWTMEQRFAAGKPGAIDVVTRVSCDRPRDVVFLPMLVVLPGAGSFGENKKQALFAGLEYLDRDEPSSSEKDIVGPGAQRQVPDSARITFPLMAVQANSRYLGLAWDRSPKFCALFDSPDRTFRSGGHVMGILYPGSDGTNRKEGSLLPYGPERLPANRPLILRATLMGGRGESVVPAIRHYVSLRGLPAVPDPGLDAAGYYALATAGWLDSGIHEGSRYRHAWPGSFGAQPAADAAWWMDWLAVRSKDPKQAERLRTAAAEAIEGIPARERNSATVGHNRFPVPSLLYDGADEMLLSARTGGRDTLKRFEADGTVLYRKPDDGSDLARTHFARHANGLTADLVARVLDAAVFTGDDVLRSEGLRLLNGLERYRNTAPRGAQTWEVPLHTPDILASANLVRAYVLGYELTGDGRYLDLARHWAWTGVPFVYLSRPTEGNVGPYATIAVYGATQWVSPNWMGLPVQWCGLVYADALDRLRRYDPSGPWRQIASGIAASGIQQTMPVGLDPKRQGLLPDSYDLKAGVRNDVHINPATLLPCAARLYGEGGFYDYHVFADGVTVHAPGALVEKRREGDRHLFRVQGWPDRPYRVLVTGLPSPPHVSVDGRETPGAASGLYLPEHGALVLELTGTRSIVLIVPKPSAGYQENRLE